MTNAQLFEAGAKLFHTPYNGLDGVGMKHTIGGAPVNRFSVGPQAVDSPFRSAPSRAAAATRMPFDSVGRLAHTRVFFDVDQDGKPPFNARGTTSLFGDGLLQLLAQEMTEQLLARRDAAAQQAKAKAGTPVKQELKANGVDFGIAHRHRKRQRRGDVRHVPGSRRVAGSRDSAAWVEGATFHRPRLSPSPPATSAWA